MTTEEFFSIESTASAFSLSEKNMNQIEFLAAG
jgi:hypothetical protein